MSRRSRGFPRLLTVRSEVIATFAVVAATGLIFWASGFERTIVKDWAQIAFWITASMVAWLTYLNARRGVLQPLRTEVFKSQLEALKNVQSLFSAKTERELHSLVGLDEMVKRNAQKVLADYAKVQFAQSYKTTRMELGDGWRPLNPGVARAIQDPKWLAADAVTSGDRAAFWASYKISGLEIPSSYGEGCDTIRQVLEHPLLPSTVRESLEAYMNALYKNIDILTEVLNRCAMEFPQKYPTYASIDQVSDGVTGQSWIWNAFYRELSQDDGKNYLRRFAENVLRSVREYLQVENLLTS